MKRSCSPGRQGLRLVQRSDRAIVCDVPPCQRSRLPGVQGSWSIARTYATIGTIRTRQEQAMQQKQPVDPQDRKGLFGGGGIGRDIWPF